MITLDDYPKNVIVDSLMRERERFLDTIDGLDCPHRSFDIKIVIELMNKELAKLKGDN